MDTIIEDKLQSIMWSLDEEATPEDRSLAKKDCVYIAKAYSGLEQKLNGAVPVTSGIEIKDGVPVLEYGIGED